MKLRLKEFMEAGISEQVFPGAVLLVGIGEEIVHLSAHGRISRNQEARPVSVATCFDLSSLTKILATCSVMIRLLNQKTIKLENKLCEFVTGYGGALFEQTRLLHLLEHSAGLVGWRPYFHELAAFAGGSFLQTKKGLQEIRNQVALETQITAPGQTFLYSDLGFILLDWVIETASGRSLDRCFADWVTTPLRIKNLFFIDCKNRKKAAGTKSDRVFAATEDCPWRGRTIIGEVHDENCYAMGGVSGHAGLFGQAQDVWLLAREWLRADQDRSDVFEESALKRFWQRSEVSGSTRALGFDTPAQVDSAVGCFFGRRSVGHLGFTGTSLWLDPERKLVVVLLTNRVHPSRNNLAIKKFRPQIHDLVIESFFGVQNIF